MTDPQYPANGPQNFPPASQPVPGSPMPPQAGGEPSGPSGQPAAPPPPAGKRGNILTSKPAIGIAALIIGLVLGTGTGSGKTASGSAPAPTITVTATQTTTIEATPEDNGSPEPTTEPSDDTTETPTAPPKRSYESLSSRKFKLMAKDPDSYIGKTYVVYGEITQFDSATGTDTFRADTGPKKLRISYGFVDYSQNTILSGSESKLKKLVEGDCFTAKVTVLGSYSYDTQIGGNTTVPLLQVDSISVYGSTD